MKKTYCHDGMIAMIREITKEAIVAMMNEEEGEEFKGINNIFDDAKVMTCFKHEELAATSPLHQ